MSIDLGDFTQYVDSYHEHVFTEGGYNIMIFCSRDEEPVTVTVPSEWREWLQEAPHGGPVSWLPRAERDGC